MPSKKRSDTFRSEGTVALFPQFRPAPGRNQLKPLRLPVCLPQESFGDSNITRAYAPELQESGVEMDDWIRFIDGLNMAMTASPPLRVVETTGMIIGFVPNELAMVVGTAMEIGAGARIHSQTKSLTDSYLRHANDKYFSPRGLRVRLCKTAAMRRLVGLDPTPASEDPSAPTPKESKGKKLMQKVGHWTALVTLHVPIMNLLYSGTAASVPAIPAGIGGVTARRLAMIGGHTLPLSFDVPPKEKATGKLADLEARLQAHAKKRDAKLDRKRQLLAIQEGRATSLEGSTSRLDEATSIGGPASSTLSLQDQPGREPDWKQVQKDLEDEERARRRAEKGRVSRRLRTDVQIADRKEWKMTELLIWVVVLNADEDKQIQGKEIVDNDANSDEAAGSHTNVYNGRKPSRAT